MSTITPTRKRTMRCRNRSASIVKFTPAPAERVNPRIGPASADGRRPPAHQALEHGFELPLYRAPFPLPLPAHEPRPIVVHHGEVGPAGHGRKIEKTGGSIKPRNPLSHLTKDDFSG